MPQIKLKSVSVDIPLRGLAHKGGGDCRVSRNSAGELVVGALRDVSLQIAAGDRVGIAGSNGAGKSTLLRVMGGLMPISSGSMAISGAIYGVFNLTDGIRSSLTGRENAKLRYYLLGEPGGSVDTFIEDTRAFADLGEFFELPVNTYSPGMMSRLLFGMATFKRANVLLMDEWIGVADASFQKKVLTRIEKFTSATDIFVLASHDGEILRRVTDRIIVMEKGRVARELQSREIVAEL